MLAGVSGWVCRVLTVVSDWVYSVLAGVSDQRCVEC